MFTDDRNKETKDPGQIIFICHGPFVQEIRASECVGDRKQSNRDGQAEDTRQGGDPL